ncbi:MAG: SusD/RagB family nutrient-binding outer membrane lipoprotein [Chryseolinea sp.]
MEKIFKRFGILLLLLASSCDLDGDLQNPNEISVSGADVDLVMNAVQLDFADFFNAASGGNITGTTAFGVDALVRMQAMTTGYRYQTADQAQYTDDLWTLAYQNVLINAETLIPLAESKNLTTHVAVAKILKAYVYLTLVDLFGDVPQSEALKAAEGNFNPAVDGGEEIYAYAIGLLGEARTELAKTGTDAGGGLARDIYYGGNRDKWNALANTLELKAWLNISMISTRTAEANTRINVLLGDDLIDTEEENFTYKYGTVTNPVSRHPLYEQYYGPNEGSASGYLANYYLYELYNGKGVEDPRWRYYFYRQVGSLAQATAVDSKAIGCDAGAIPDHYANGGYIFCTFDPGFYGRDHGDASGTPPDGTVKTCVGVYPAGGQIDNTLTSNDTYWDPTIRGDGGNGEGIQPIFMSFFTDYMKAEILARANDAGAKAQLATAIDNSITQVRKFAKNLGQELGPGREPSTVDYQAAVATMFDNATNKLDVIGREYWVACWGNGIEAYNNYRRTSAPKDPQPTVRTNPGPFLRSLIYPSVYVNLNSSATQKDVNATNKVFWDTNPDNLQ